MVSLSRVDLHIKFRPPNSSNKLYPICNSTAGRNRLTRTISFSPQNLPRNCPHRDCPHRALARGHTRAPDAVTTCLPSGVTHDVTEQECPSRVRAISREAIGKLAFQGTQLTQLGDLSQLLAILWNDATRCFTQPGLLSKAGKAPRTVSKEFYQPFKPGRKCLDADELQAMRDETVRNKTVRNKTEPCKNTARVMYNPEQGIQRALMCAIMSVDKDLHVDMEECHWEQFQENKSVKCFDDNYARRWTPAQRRELLRRWLESALTKSEPGAGVWALHLFFDGFSQTGARWRRLDMITGGTVLLV